MPSRTWLSTPLAATCVTVLVLAPALSACGGLWYTLPTKTVTATAAPTTTTTSQRDAVEAWWETTRVPAQELRDAMGEIAAATDREDPIAAVGIKCQAQHDAIEQFQQHLPSPDPQLTAQLQKALGDYDAAAEICTTAMENLNLDDLAQVGTRIREGNTYMDNAVKILNSDRGESSNPAPSSPNPSSPSLSANSGDADTAGQQLSRIANDDRPYATENLANRWIPQLSSKKSTEPWTVDPENGVTYDPVRILQEHRQLRQQYPVVKLLWAGAWSTFSNPNFWVTVVGIPFDDSSGAMAWCSSQSLDSDHCTATRLHN
jgi:hypothetical protein